MRATIDIPDQDFRELKMRAAREGTTMRELVLRALTLLRQDHGKPREPFVVPVIRSSRPGSLKLTKEEIDEIASS